MCDHNTHDVCLIAANLCVAAIKSAVYNRKTLNRRTIYESNRHIKGELDLEGSISKGSLAMGEYISSKREYDDNTALNRLYKSVLSGIAEELKNPEFSSFKDTTRIIKEATMLEQKFTSIQLGNIDNLIVISKKLRNLRKVDIKAIQLSEFLHSTFREESDKKLNDIGVRKSPAHRIFEQFVRTFFINKYTKRYVYVDTFIHSGILNPKEVNYIPKSVTDITIKTKERVVVIDTKYEKEIFSGSRNNRVLDPEHTRQLEYYMGHYALKYRARKTIGLLLYADTDEIKLNKSGVPIVKDMTNTVNGCWTWETIDLSLPFRAILDELEKIADKVMTC
jgi:5-methylcytosine-specific restriction enzyme subunit McrC